MARGDIERAWFRWLEARKHEDFNIVFSEELSRTDAPRPRPPFITLKLISGPRTKGSDDLRRVGNGFKITGLRQYTLSIQAFGEGGYDALEDYVTRLDDQLEAADLRRDVGIGIVSRGDVVDISALLETGYERRAQLDVIFSCSTEVDAVAAPIERVSVGGTIKEGSHGDKEVPAFEVDKN
jgi:hypothetical protein